MESPQVNLQIVRKPLLQSCINIDNRSTSSCNALTKVLFFSPSNNESILETTSATSLPLSVIQFSTWISFENAILQQSCIKLDQSSMTTFDSTQENDFSIAIKSFVCPIFFSNIFAAFLYLLFDFLIVKMIVLYTLSLKLWSLKWVLHLILRCNYESIVEVSCKILHEKVLRRLLEILVLGLWDEVCFFSSFTFIFLGHL